MVAIFSKPRIFCSKKINIEYKIPYKLILKNLKNTDKQLHYYILQVKILTKNDDFK